MYVYAYVCIYIWKGVTTNHPEDLSHPPSGTITKSWLHLSLSTERPTLASRINRGCGTLVYHMHLLPNPSSPSGYATRGPFLLNRIYAPICTLCAYIFACSRFKCATSAFVSPKERKPAFGSPGGEEDASSQLATLTQPFAATYSSTQRKRYPSALHPCLSNSCRPVPTENLRL